MAQQLGPFSTDFLPKLQPLADLGLRLDEPAWQVREAIGARFDWGRGQKIAGNGLLVCDVIAESDAAKTDIVPGDVLVAMDFGAGGIQPLSAMEDFDLAMAQLHPGDVARLVLFRRGGEVTVDVRCGEWDVILDPLPESGISRHYLAWTPMKVEWVNARRLECLKDFRLKKDALALKDRADLALIHQQYAAAAEDYAEFLKAWPKAEKAFPALFGRAYALRMAGNFKETANALAEAGKARPQSMAVELEGAELLLAQKNYGEARRKVESVERSMGVHAPAAYEQEIWSLRMAFMDEVSSGTRHSK